MKDKPPKGSQCDATVGYKMIQGQPVLQRCPNPATQILKGLTFWDTYACDTCAPELLKGRTRP